MIIIQLNKNQDNEKELNIIKNADFTYQFYLLQCDWLVGHLLNGGRKVQFWLVSWPREGAPERSASVRTC